MTTSSPPATTPAAPATPPAPPEPRTSLAGLGARGLVGGLLMGVANVVPGISGGAMLLIVGIYHAFIGAIASLTAFRFRLRHIVLLGCIGTGAVVAILLSAGPVKTAVLDYRWQVFSLFIGMRLGAAPLVWRLCKPATPAVWVGVAVGLVVTAALATVQYTTSGAGGPIISGTPGFFLAGLIGASATILPGMDGSYFLLLMGKYVPILGSIDRFKDALTAGSWSGMTAEMPALFAVAAGVAIGLAGVSTLLRWLFAHHQKITGGVLLGIVVGAVGGLWPFRQLVEPKIGEVIRGKTVTAENLAAIPRDHWPMAFFSPTPLQIASALGLVVLGYVLTTLLSRLDPGEEHLTAVQHSKTH